MFSKILIANRSEIARRVIRTCSDMGIATVAVFSEYDTDAVFVRDADEAVALPPGSSYLDGSSIIDATLHTGATAIHPGYGFLSENAAFATAVEAAGITFIGPSPETISAMGSKLVSRELMQAAGVPVLEVAELQGGGGIDESAKLIGYPLLVKASRGGGGKGMRIVTDAADLLGAIESAAREAESAFGDGTVYLEQYVANPRHVEVQIFGDGSGHVVHLYERECSVQRRFQKVIEETPSPDLDTELRERLWEAAVTAAESVSYRGAGTVEFIIDPSGDFSFLEMNTRIQVEHPVTEMTTGVDLVRMQIEIAAGRPLIAQADVPARVGHAIEARLSAESPADGYLPSTGVVHRFTIPDGVRVDTGITDGSVVTHHYDPMIAKVIAHAPSREEAAAILAQALRGGRIHGVDTNRDLLVRILSDDEFLAGAVDTHFLERRGEEFAASPMSEAALRASVAAATLGIQAENRRKAVVLASIPSGWRNVASQGQTLTLVHAGVLIAVSYRLDRGSLKVDVDGVSISIDAVYSIGSTLVDLSVDGVRRRFDLNRVRDDVYVDSPLGSTHFTIAPRFAVSGVAAVPGSMTAKTPGVVVAISVACGDDVAAGETVMVIEAMKMEQAIVSAASGRVIAVHFAVGDQVARGETLIEIESDHDDG